MLPYVRRAIIAALLLSAIGSVVAAVSYNVRLVSVPKQPSDALTVGLYLLTTIAQGIATLLGITIAVIFIAAQFGPTSRLVRSGMEIFKDRTALGILTFFSADVVVSLVSLASIDRVLSAKAYWILDINLVFAIVAVLLVIPLTLSQIENLNPYYLARKLCRRITSDRIARYGLVISEPASAVRLEQYRLRVWGHQHGREDPLGAFHEIVMTTVERRDRFQLAALMRLLLQRIAVISGASFSLTPQSSVTATSKLRLRRRSASRWLRRPDEIPNRIGVTLHILHYYIRRSYHLRKEWGDVDGVRQQFLLDLRDLIQALAQSFGNNVGIEAALFAVLHISLGYADVPRHGEDEALLWYGDLPGVLDASGYAEAALQCAGIIGFISASTVHLPADLVAQVRGRFARSGQEAFEAAANLDLIAWSEGVGKSDPWRSRLATYKRGGCAKT